MTAGASEAGQPAPRSARQLAAEVAASRRSATEVVRDSLDRAQAQEPTILAFRFIEAEPALRQAERLDEGRRRGRAPGPLEGVPVGVKDIVDTADMPTECGSAALAGRRPATDATLVARLRAAGAVVLGKTVTTEFAFYTPGPTRNPRDPTRTPGGSSSGSAAAVAAEIVPLAIGSQTNGSVIRPASFCGVIGYKPAYGLIPRTGVCLLSRRLDHVGTFSRTLGDAARLVDVLAGDDPADPDSLAGPGPQLEEALAAAPAPPRFAFVRGPAWDEAAGELDRPFGQLRRQLGEACDEPPVSFDQAKAMAAHRTIMAADMAFNLGPQRARAADRLSQRLRDFLDEGAATPAVAYLEARAQADASRRAIEALFDRHDAIVTPAAPGEAPLGLESTGNPAFCTLWTLAGLPALTLPLLEGRHGLPIGCQLICRSDAGLFRAARWLAERLARPELVG